MSIKRIVFVIISMAILDACNSPQKENEKLESEVIAIHDEVMPVMGKLKSLQKSLAAKADELTQVDSLLNQQKITSLRNTTKELDEAYENMFVWMRQFDADQEGMTEEEVAQYLRQQKEMVEKVNAEIKNVIEKAEELN